MNQHASPTQPAGARARRLCLHVGITLAGLLAAATSARADVTDLAAVPLITSSPQIVKPNLMMILDDSGSMAWSHMPDTVENFARNGDTGTAKYGYVSAQCNGVYYNPKTVYAPPVQVASGGTITALTPPTWPTAYVDGFNTGAGTVNLTTGFQAWTSATTNNTAVPAALPAGAAYYYRYTGSQTTAAQKNYLNTSSTFYSECNTLVGNSATDPFTKVTVSSTSGTVGVGPGVDERQNFVNWYSYYRTRMLMMKSATGAAFRDVDDKYRVGYMTINGNASQSFLNIDTFGSTQKYNWYSKLYGATPNNSTPLREALSKAGRMYANKVSTINGVNVTDPVQYSCQKNFALLSTDGYWNGTAGYQVDGSTGIGNQDTPDPSPYNDGGREANVYTATVSISGAAKNDNVTSVKVNGVQILSATAYATGGGTRSENLAQSITANINACTAAVSGACSVAGYKAVRTNSSITITAPAAVSGSPAVVVNGSAAAAVTAFVSTTITIAGTTDTLADVAAYYYKTDLRTTGLSNQNGALGTSVELNNVLPSLDDDATYQHMTTYTLGLGAPGRMVYSPTYKTDTTGHYAAILNGSTATGAAGPCPWQASGTCTWPAPASGGNGPETIDDLWHAAVNGRGSYFSAADSASLSVGLNSALQSINAMTSDAAAASTSNPNITSGDNYLFSSTFRTAEWTGEFERRQVDPATGALAASPDWTAAAQLDAKASRTIYTFDTNVASTTKLKPFLWGNLTAVEQAYFTTSYIGSTAVPALSQFCAAGATCLSAAAQTAAGGAPLVAFLRGDRTNEGSTGDANAYFRQREKILGDIVDAEAVYVNRPQFDYVDAGYSTFKTTGIATTRAAMVYVGANDGMLHAFNAATGDEAWAYVPKLLLPTLYRLADKFYATKHNYYVDGSPTVGDVYFGGAWHTILVGGFNGGARGYYALDITDPANPKALWEFTDTNMGYSYGRPEITKLATGEWVVLLTSGYNNVNPGNGQGYLYVVNAGTGTATHTIGTGVGSATAAIAGVCTTAPCPSGLAQIRAFVENSRYDNTATKVYGGDLFGNVWRFDINDTIAPSGREAQLLATLRSPSGAVQSVTARPELGKVAGYPVVYLGTGRYLGAADLSDTTVQSIYAIKDNGGTASVGSPRSDLTATGFVQQTLTNATCGTSAYCTTGSKIRTGSTNAVNFATQKGWFVDLPGSGERANTDPQLALGTLAITTNVLDPSACTVGGTSFINYFDYRTGQPISTAYGLASVYLDAALATRVVLVKFQDGSVRGIVRLSNNSTGTLPTPLPPNPTATRRTSWRELITQ